MDKAQSSRLPLIVRQFHSRAALVGLIVLLIVIFAPPQSGANVADDVGKHYVSANRSLILEDLVTISNFGTCAGEIYRVSADRDASRQSTDETSGGMTIVLIFDSDDIFMAAGLTEADIVEMKAANVFAARQFVNNFDDPIHVNICVTAEPGTTTTGRSMPNTLPAPVTYATLRNALDADSTTVDDATVLGESGSVPLSDPIDGGSIFILTKAQGKALGLAADDLTVDGTYTFGGGNPFTYDPHNRAVFGKTDYIGVSMHEFSEIMGRVGVMGIPPRQGRYSELDLFSFTGANTRGLNSGGGRHFSLDAGKSFLMPFNDGVSNGGDFQDWLSLGDDSFNSVQHPNVENILSDVDLRTMDVIGYNRTGVATPSPTATPTNTPTGTFTPTPIPTPIILPAPSILYDANLPYGAFGEPIIDSMGNLIVESVHSSGSFCTPSTCGLRLNSISPSGMLNWQTPNDGSFISPETRLWPLILGTNDSIFVPTYGTALHEFDSHGTEKNGFPVTVAPKGTANWQFPANSPVLADSQTGLVYASAGELMSFSSFPNRIVALAPNGSEQWSVDYSDGGRNTAAGNLVKGPQGDIYTFLFTNMTARFTRLDETSGNVVCDLPTIAGSDRLGGDEQGVFTDYRTTLYKFGSDCASTLIYSQPDRFIEFRKYHDGTIYAIDYPVTGDDPPQILAVSSTGEILWRNPNIIPTLSQPFKVIKNGYVYLLGLDHLDNDTAKLFVINAVSGTVLKTLDTSALCGLACYVAVADNDVIYLASGDKIYRTPPISEPSPTQTQTPANTPTATPTPTGAAVLSGTVTYGNAIPASTRFVSNALITAAGSPTFSVFTDGLGATAGQYSLTGFGSGAFMVTPTKVGAQNGAITSFDAAKIAQQAAGVANPPFNANQLILADVSGTNGITSFDAAEVARWVAGFSTLVGQTGNWIFQPASRNYPSVTTSIAGEDYSGLLMGEVSGNWQNNGSRSGDSGSSRGGPERNTGVALPQLVTWPDSEVVIPVNVEGAADKGIISYEFDLRYDPAVIQPQASAVDVADTVSGKFSVVANAEEAGLLRVVVYGAMPIKGDGLLMNLRFTAVGPAGSISPLTWERLVINEGDPMAVVTDGQVELSAVE